MKKLLYFLAPFLSVIVIAFFAYQWLQSLDNPGYVIMGIGHWSLEKTLVEFITGLAISFFILYLFFRLLGWLFRIPGQLKRRGINIKFNRSQEALIAGLVDSAEGNFERAENVLIKHAPHSGAPLIHYLTAARAAQSRGALDKRDQYLKQAADQAPDSSVAVGLTQAELHLSGKEFDQALSTLTQLHSIDPAHAGVLKLLHQTYKHLGDWEGIQKLIPSLHQNKVLMEAEVKLLEAEIFIELLKQAAGQGDVEKIELLWVEIPKYIKNMHGVLATYFTVMLEVGAGAKIEDELTKALSVNWDENLLILFSNIPSNDVEKQLKMAELWLPFHADNALLLMVLGKLSVKCNEFEKAKAYLTQSITATPTVQAYQLLGDLMLEQGDKDSASQCYKQGLELLLVAG
ncbi:MAG: heme biosynthesis protein HemY [Methylococcaceae bacterium]|nr:heme biosynthesis protein HemY [Methylococcaceae bacterium]MDD1609182.1 heme biosynthesis protein HemY [Methylococcaceae bacterium]